jgi:hypothetical protein
LLDRLSPLPRSASRFVFLIYHLSQKRSKLIALPALPKLFEQVFDERGAGCRVLIARIRSFGSSFSRSLLLNPARNESGDDIGGVGLDAGRGVD